MVPPPLRGNRPISGILPTTPLKLTLDYAIALARLTPASYSGGAVVGSPVNGERASRLLMFTIKAIPNTKYLLDKFIYISCYMHLYS
jgi:hypothetical protein